MSGVTSPCHGRAVAASSHAQKSVSSVTNNDRGLRRFIPLLTSTGQVLSWFFMFPCYGFIFFKIEKSGTCHRQSSHAAPRVNIMMKLKQVCAFASGTHVGCSVSVECPTVTGPGWSLPAHPATHLQGELHLPCFFLPTISPSFI